MFKTFKLILLFFVVFNLSSCMSPQDRLVHRNYEKALRSYSDDAKIYRGADCRLIWGATYRNEAFQDAYIEEYIRRYRLTGDKRDAFAATVKENTGKYNEFFISVFTQDQEWNDLDKSKSLWRLYLENDKGSRVEPISVKKHLEDDHFYGEFFPYLDSWSIGYTVRFPKLDTNGAEINLIESTFLKLTITGAKGESILTWKQGSK